MVRLSKRLDPSQTGNEAEKLNSDLRKLVVGQDEAIDQIVNIYQTFLAGMTSPGRPIGNFLFLAHPLILPFGLQLLPAPAPPELP